MDQTAEIIEPQEEEEAPQPKPKKPKAAKLSEPKPKKETKKKKKKSTPKMTMSVEDIQGQIIGGHMMLSMFVPGATITEEAAMNEAVAIKRIIDIYGMEWLERITPWVSLAIVVGVGEMPTMIAIKEKIASAKASKKLHVVKEPMNDGTQPTGD